MLGPQKFGWATRLLSVVAQVATAVLKLVYIPAISHLIIIFLDFTSGESSISFNKQGYDPGR